MQSMYLPRAHQTGDRYAGFIGNECGHKIEPISLLLNLSLKHDLLFRITSNPFRNWSDKNTLSLFFLELIKTNFLYQPVKNLFLKFLENSFSFTNLRIKKRISMKYRAKENLIFEKKYFIRSWFHLASWIRVYL